MSDSVTSSSATRTESRRGLNVRAKASGIEMQAKTKAEQYAFRKAAYRAGTVMAVPTLDGYGATMGMYGLMIVESCNWLGNISLFGLDCWVHDLPAADELDDLVSGCTVLEMWDTGDAMTRTGDAIIVGDLSDFDVDAWPTPVVMWINEIRGPSVGRMRARKLMPYPIDSPEVFEFKRNAVPLPWMEVRPSSPNYYPNVRMSDLQHVRTPADVFNSLD